MKKTLLTFFIAAFLLMTAGTSNTFAFSLQGIDTDYGWVNFDFVGADYGTTYVPEFADVDETFVSDVNGVSDSWGILNVVSIYQEDMINPLWAASGDTIEIAFGGLDDHDVTWDADAESFQINSAAIDTGSYLKMYYDPNPADTDYTTGPGATDPGKLAAYPLWNIGEDGQLLLELEFVPGVIDSDDTTVLAATFDVDYLHGDGQGYLKVVGGEWAELYETGAFLDGEADFHFEYSAGDLPGLQFLQYNWTVEVDGITTGNAIPEPATMILLGSGLLGLAGFGRRKQLKNK